MKVTTGSARGKILLAPQGMHTRPITDKIKQAIFSSIQFKVPNSQFLDLFAGSGSMSCEALSRGAKHAILVDNDNEAIKIINQNLTNCHFDKNSFQVYQNDVFNVINNLANKQQFDIIYLDPPFTVESIFIPVMQAVDQANLLKDNGVLMIRSHVDKKLPEQFTNLIKTKEKKYGISMVHYYKTII